MYKQYRILGIIPARGTNDEVEHLNIKQLGGRPMLVYSVERALKTSFLDTVIVSTEDEKTAKIAEATGALVPFLRPPELSSPKATLANVVIHALNNLEEDYHVVVMLLPNSPFRRRDDIDQAIALLGDGDYDSVISVVEERDFFWYIHNDSFKPLTHEGASGRRECKPIYRMAGGIEVCWTKNYETPQYLGQNIGFYMMRKHNALTIYNIYDLLVAERLVKLPESLIYELIQSE